jgi:hypothetical protein
LFDCIGFVLSLVASKINLLSVSSNLKINEVLFQMGGGVFNSPRIPQADRNIKELVIRKKFNL